MSNDTPSSSAIPPIEDLLKVMRDLAVAGGNEAMIHYGRVTEVMTKADSSPLTAADLAVDEIIVSGLERAFPEIPIITEERAENHATDHEGQCFFLVDPIDGTKEFINRRDEFTVNIALVDNGSPIAGVVCAPAVDRLFWGAANSGAFEEKPSDTSGQGPTPIRVRDTDNSAMIAIASRSHLTPETKAFLDANPISDLTSAGSSLKFCLVASGEADIYPRFGPTMEWDTAAAHAVLAAAGGFVELENRQPLTYGKPDHRNPYFIARTASAVYLMPS